MTPHNTVERKNSFLYFLLFFIVTVSLIMLAVFFGMQVPFKENDSMKNEIASMQQGQSFMQNFTVMMDSTQNLLDNINRPGQTQPPEITDGSITANLNTLTQMLSSDSSHSEIYKNVVKNLADLQVAKKQIRDAGGSDATIDKLNQQVQTLTNQVNTDNAIISSLNSKQ